MGGAGASGGSVTTTSVDGPTGGIEPLNGSVAYEFISPPLAAAVTIDRDISFTLGGAESNALANACIGCRIDKIAAIDLALTTIYAGVDDAELGAEASMTWTGTATSTNLAKGDRLRAVVYFDDLGTMATGYTLTFYYNAASSTRLSFMTFSQVFSFQTFTGAQYIYPIDTASDVATADVDYKAWTSRGT
jgi:hypothetical protein